MIKREGTLRRPPAFQEYAADWLAREEVRFMSLSEIGLLTLMRWYCWVNDTLPSEPALIARALGVPEADVLHNLTTAVRSYFDDTRPILLGLGERLECKELAGQMDQLMARRRAQSEAAETTNAKRYGKRTGKRGGKRGAPEKSRAKQSQKLLSPPASFTPLKEAA